MNQIKKGGKIFYRKIILIYLKNLINDDNLGKLRILKIKELL